MVDNVLYIFGGEKASGAEIVIERLISNNKIQSHLLIAPGEFANSLLKLKKPYKISVVKKLKKLNRSSSPVLVFYLRAVYNYIYISCLAYRYIKKNNIDVVHSNVIGPASYLLPLIIVSPLFCSRVRWVWSDHDLKYYYPLDKFISKMCARFYHATIAVSKAVKSKYGYNNKVFVLYNGLNCDFFNENKVQRESFRAARKFETDDLVIGIAGVISLRKGHLSLIKSFNKLRLKYPTINLVIAGRFGEDDNEYNNEVIALLHSPGVFYLGHLEEIASFYNGCDIVVSNSDIRGSEPLGTTIYEAMACKKIVVASDTGGTIEIIDHNVDGYIFEADNPDKLSAQLSYVIENYKQLEDIKLAARKKVTNKFNLDIMSLTYEKFLHDLSEGKMLSRSHSNIL